MTLDVVALWALICGGFSLTGLSILVGLFVLDAWRLERSERRHHQRNNRT